MILKDFFTSMDPVGNNFDSYAKNWINIVQTASNLLTQKLSQIDWDKIHKSINMLTFITNLKSIGFPPCIHLESADIQEINAMFADDSVTQEKKVIFILNKYDVHRIKSIEQQWNKLVLEPPSFIMLLCEAIDNYINEKYYSCTALLVCQYSHTISKNNTILEKLSTADEEIYKRLKWLEQEQINSIKEKTKKNDSYQINLETDRNRIFRHLDIYRNIETIHFLVYFDSYVYGDKYMGNHPNRNKICHGKKKDFGTQETALKAILCMDILLRCPEIFQYGKY